MKVIDGRGETTAVDERSGANHIAEALVYRSRQSGPRQALQQQRTLERQTGGPPYQYSTAQYSTTIGYRTLLSTLGQELLSRVSGVSRAMPVGSTERRQSGLIFAESEVYHDRCRLDEYSKVPSPPSADGTDRG